MNLLNLFSFKSKPKITIEMLQKYQINIIPMDKLKLDKTSPLAITGSGTFYKGLYENTACSIKIVDITKDDTMINEFLYWDLYKNVRNFLQFQGAAISGSEGYLIFDFFAFTIQYALENKLITEQNQYTVVKQCLNILQILQCDGKKTTDIRPGIFGITDNVEVKLLDFGILINHEKIFNNDIILKDRLKYQPPEYFNYQGEDVNYDIWSFGCFMLDMYSIEKPVYKYTYSQAELSKRIQKEVYPEIPSDISPILANILNRCFEKDYKRRIKIDLLLENLEIFFQETVSPNDLSKSNNNDGKGNDHSFDYDEDSRLDKCYKFAKQIDITLNKTYNLLTSTQFNGPDHKMDQINGYYNNAIKKLNNNYSQIKEALDLQYKMNLDILLKFKEKLINNTIIMKQFYAFTLNDIAKTQKTSNEIKRGIDLLGKFTNMERSKKMIDNYEKSVEQIKIEIQKFSEKEPYDKIQKIYDENDMIVKMFDNVSNDSTLLLSDIKASIDNHKNSFNSDYNIRGLAAKFGMEDDLLDSIRQETKQLNKKRICDLYAKAQDNSKIIVIYNMNTKTITQMKISEPNEINLNSFNSKCYSYYDVKTKSIYVTGGLSDSTNKHSYDDSFIQVIASITPDEDGYLFNFKQLCPMNTPRCSHSMIKHCDEYYIVVGGLKTKSCEIYSVSNNKWGNLPELPSIAPNPGVALFDNYVYVFTGATGIDALFRMSMGKLNHYIEGSEDREQYLQWENINYFMPDGRLKRGMGIFPIGRNLTIFGGFDNDSNYDEVFSIAFTMEDNNSNSYNVDKSRESLPTRTYFSSNMIMMDNSTLVMVDGLNNALEYDINTKQYYYYT